MPRMIPIDNGRMIAACIPSARLVELKETGHLYPTEAPHVDEEIIAFIRFLTPHRPRVGHEPN